MMFAIVIAAAAGGLAPGCGSSSSDTTSATTWADGLCRAVVTWKSDMTSIGTGLKAGVPSKTTLQDASDQAGTATQKLTDSLKSLGKPDTQSGAEAKDAVDQLRTQLGDGADAIKSATEDVSSASGILLAVSSIASTLSTMVTQVSTTATTLEQLDPEGELQDAFSKASSCKVLQSG